MRDRYNRRYSHDGSVIMYVKVDVCLWNMPCTSGPEVADMVVAASCAERIVS